MRDIGLKLKEKREENGVSIEEAAEDLKVRPKQILSLEEGKKDDFKDVVFLKYLIRDYSKYLGLDSEKMVDEFNEFLFDFTSRIPIEEIEEAKKEKKNNKKNTSPYTLDFNNNKKKYIIYLIVGLVIISILLGCVLMGDISKNDFNSNNYLIGGIYE